MARTNRKQAATKSARGKTKKRPASKKRATKRAPSRVTIAASTSKLINTVAKGILLVEPPINADPANFTATFRTKLNAALADLTAQGKPFKLVEGFRTTDRQQWLYGSGRPTAVPYGRPGPIVTNADGVTKKSKHQGTGVAGSGKAADCYPTRNGKVFIPPSSDPIWSAYATAVKAQGLVAGQDFTTLKDSPHCELV